MIYYALNLRQPQIIATTFNEQPIFCHQQSQSRQSETVANSVPIYLGNGMFRSFEVLPLDVSPLHWTFRHLDVSLPGCFAHSLDVLLPTVDVSPLSAFLCVCFFFHMGHLA